MKNLNLLFNKSIYSKFKNVLDINDKGSRHTPNEINLWNIAVKQACDRTKDIIEVRFMKDDYSECQIDGVITILMRVCYPGLTMGLGYGHVKENKIEKNNASDGTVNREQGIQVDNGFSFDYVTGQPYLPGSSVKGVLHSAFRHPEVIGEIMGLDDAGVSALEKEIFEHNDVFLDAVIRHGVQAKDKNEHGKILAIDNITPHKDPLKSPEIHSMLRVKPGVVMEFRFLLKDSEHANVTQKRELFTTILEEFGVGAKTNVGYGVLKKTTESEVSSYVFPVVNQKASVVGQAVQTVQQQLVPGDVYSVQVNNLVAYGAFAKLVGYPDKTGLIHCSQIPEGVILQPGQIVKARYSLNNQGKISLSMKGVPQD